MKTGFAAAFAKGDATSLARRCLEQLPQSSEANLGIVYVTEPAAVRFPQLVQELAAGTGIANWVGGVGLGLCAVGEEVYERAAAAVLTASLAEEKFRLFSATDDPAADLPRDHGEWIEAEQPSLALVHADPRCRDLVKITIETGLATGAFLVGGLVSHRCATPLLAAAAGAEGDGFGTAGIAGLMLSPEIGVATALSQGCTPIGPVRRIDEARDNAVMVVDGRPALSVFKDDIGPALAEDMRRLGNVVFAGLPVAGSDTGDYLVRNLLAIDASNGWIVLGAEVASGDQILFCRRDPDSARADMDRMVRQLARRLAGPPKAGVYVSCVARGVSLFDEPGVEGAVIREAFGDIPMVGFFANGEISRDRLYGHTGVLTLFT